MKVFAVLLVALSVAFGIFSIANGVSYDELNSAWSRSYDHPDRERIRARIAQSQEEVLSTVKAISIPYYLVSLGFFVGVLRATSLRKTSIVAIFVCVVMVAWSLILSARASFDEVYLAWVAAAIIIAILGLMVRGALTKREAAAS